MFLFGHMGFTLGAARALEKHIGHRRPLGNPKLSFYALVLAGSLLPDIIDKPLGGMILKETLGNGRVYGHTLVFLLLLSGLGIYARRRYGWGGVLVLAGGSLAHDILDSMWRQPETLLWPFYGWGFPKNHPELWFNHWITSLVTDPRMYVPEIIGGLILLICAGDYLYRRQKCAAGYAPR